MANYNNNQNGGDLASWIVTVIFLMTPLWPVGLIMLLRKVLGLGRKSQQKRHPYDLQREAQTAPGTQGVGARRQTPPTGQPVRSRQGKPVNLDKGKGLTIGGAVMAGIFGIALVAGLPEGADARRPAGLG